MREHPTTLEDALKLTRQNLQQGKNQTNFAGI